MGVIRISNRLAVKHKKVIGHEGAPPTKSGHQKIQKNILYQTGIMIFIHISNRLAIISK